MAFPNSGHEMMARSIAIMKGYGFSYVQFCVLNHTAELPRRRADLVTEVHSISSFNPFASQDVAEVEDAISQLVERKLLCIVDAKKLEEMKVYVQNCGTLGPFYGYPSIGEIDFTTAGAACYREILAMIDTRETKHVQVSLECLAQSVRFFDSIQALEKDRLLSKNTEYERVTPIGPWCTRWWQNYASGIQCEAIWRRPLDELTVLGISLPAEHR